MADYLVRGRLSRLDPDVYKLTQLEAERQARKLILIPSESSAPLAVREALASDGTWMIVEPYAADDYADNLNPVGRVYYGFSTFLCVPNALSQPGGFSLGAHAGEAAIRRVVTDAGFTRFRRAAETPFNLVFEARP